MTAWRPAGSQFLAAMSARLLVGATWWDLAVAGAGVGLCLTPTTQGSAERAGRSHHDPFVKCV
jgi:hypothetical protein